MEIPHERIRCIRKIKIKNPPYIPENFFRSIWWILINISILHFKYFKNHFESDRLHGTCIPKSTCSILHFSGLLWQYGLHQWFAAVKLEDYQPYSTITGTCFCNNSLPYSMIYRCMCPWAFLRGRGGGRNLRDNCVFRGGMIVYSGGGGGYNFVFRGEGLRDNCVFRGRLFFDNFTICEFKEFWYFKGDPALLDPRMLRLQPSI